MIRYCLEIRPDEAIIHRVDCPGYDLSTLLGLGCVADLGEFRNTSLALDAIKREHPDAVRCRDCCQAEVLFLPQMPNYPLMKAITLPSV